MVADRAETRAERVARMRNGVPFPAMTPGDSNIIFIARAARGVGVEVAVRCRSKVPNWCSPTWTRRR